ncbi:fibronectin type III domain-containing protein [Dactylosporangium matsuzakiense]|uniref:fibronectin type III domain-containing protein n=1 Tax=Dactylosporangium matsuzakiense TaxID=53360 RepID=UPI0021FE02B3|nr:fibronectin type III domain-containing protein [Dactylosporangium matsuzakiense]UWZ48968.1 fibronectin type III domain-containing protein [Dactylosporangium matsuzakiense]
MKAGLAALSASVVVFGSAAGPAFAAMANGSPGPAGQAGPAAGTTAGQPGRSGASPSAESTADPAAAKAKTGGWGRQNTESDSNGGWGGHRAHPSQPGASTQPGASPSPTHAPADAASAPPSGRAADTTGGADDKAATTGARGDDRTGARPSPTGSHAPAGSPPPATDAAAGHGPYMDYVPDDDPSAGPGTGRDSTAAGRDDGAARMRAWAQAQGRAAASGRPYANPDTDVLGTDKRGAGRDTDARRAIPSVIAGLLAATAGGAPGPAGDGTGPAAVTTDTDDDGAAAADALVPGVSAPSAAATAEAIPEAPSNVSAQALSSGIRVSWTHSGTNVDHYAAMAQESGGGTAGICLGGDASTTTCDIVNGLTMGTAYTVKVVAYGSADDSEPSPAATSGTVVPGPPAAPSAVHATGQTATSLLVSWTAPSTPSSGIAHYVVVSDQDPSKGCTTTDAATLHCVAGSLDPATAYSFTVQAIGNGQAGDSSPSGSSDPVTPGAPDAPTGVMAVPAGPNTLRISWTAPAAARGGIAQYVVKSVEDPNKMCDTSDGASTYCEIDHLVAGGTGYTFRVQAKGMNSSGDSAWSAASSPAVVSGPPDAPTGVTVTPDDGALMVHWTAPVNHGAGVDGYLVWTAEDHALTCGPVAATEDHCTITGLSNGTAYTVQVQAQGTGNSGDSTWAAAAAATPSKAPATPAAVTATARTEAIWVGWTAGDPGSGVAKFRATATALEETKTCEAAAAETGCAILGLTAGTQYTVAVQALGKYGRDSALSQAATATPMELTIPADVPPSAGNVDSSSGTDVAPGEQITLSGTGYAPHTTITVAIYSAPTTLATTTTDGSGAFSIAVTVPAGFTGPHTLVASGVDSNGTPRYLTLGVDVATAHTVQPPAAAPAGDHGVTTGGVSGSGEMSGSLAVTGDPISSIALLGLCLLLAGFAFTTLARLRFHAAGPDETASGPA